MHKIQIIVSNYAVISVEEFWQTVRLLDKDIKVVRQEDALFSREMRKQAAAWLLDSDTYVTLVTICKSCKVITGCVPFSLPVCH